MNWSERKTSFDEETRVLLDISLHFLTEFFGHTKPRAEQLLMAFLESWWPDPFDDDWFHHDGPYRVAAAVQFFSVERGQRRDFFAWLRRTGHFQEPRDAIEYTAEHYFRALLPPSSR